MRDSLDDLWKGMEEDTTSHRALLEDMTREWECLKKNDLASLLPLLQSKEAHLTAIRTSRESIARALHGILGEGTSKDRTRTLSDLLPVVSPSQGQKVKDYQRVIEGLLHQILSVNEQNKRFIQETLRYLEGILRVFVSGGREGELTYASHGTAVPAALPPRWMSRKV